MQRIIYFLNRNKELILFLSLLLFCFYLNISYNQYNNSKFINSSNSFFSFFFESKRNITKYFDLEYQNKILIDENSKLKEQLFDSNFERIGSLNQNLLFSLKLRPIKVFFFRCNYRVLKHVQYY